MFRFSFDFLFIYKFCVNKGKQREAKERFFSPYMPCYWTIYSDWLWCWRTAIHGIPKLNTLAIHDLGLYLGIGRYILYMYTAQLAEQYTKKDEVWWISTKHGLCRNTAREEVAGWILKKKNDAPHTKEELQCVYIWIVGCGFCVYLRIVLNVVLCSLGS